jgi:biuret amidohydrolase
MQVDAIEPVKTAMIVVDMQNDFVAAGAPMETSAARAMVPKLAEALKICRDAAIRVIYTAHVHRRDGCDMGLFDDMHPPIANRDALVDAGSRHLSRARPGTRRTCDQETSLQRFLRYRPRYDLA